MHTDMFFQWVNVLKFGTLNQISIKSRLTSNLCHACCFKYYIFWTGHSPNRHCALQCIVLFVLFTYFPLIFITKSGFTLVQNQDLHQSKNDKLNLTLCNEFNLFLQGEIVLVNLNECDIINVKLILIYWNDENEF